jgi:hypothetical protein
MPMLLTISSTAQCPHGGSAVLPGTLNLDAKFMGLPFLLITDEPAIAGCTFTLPNGQPSPCVKLQWLNGTLIAKGRRNMMPGDQVPFVTQASGSLCLNAQQAPQGAAILGNPSPVEAL